VLPGERNLDADSDLTLKRREARAAARGRKAFGIDAGLLAQLAARTVRVVLALVAAASGMTPRPIAGEVGPEVRPVEDEELNAVLGAPPDDDRRAPHATA
jgi:hypothetical protein